MLAKSKPNIIQTLTSQALIDMEISHEEFIAIFKEKDKDEKMKENLRSENKKQEIIRLSRVKSKTYVKKVKYYRVLYFKKKKKKKKNCVCVCVSMKFI